MKIESMEPIPDEKAELSFQKKLIFTFAFLLMTPLVITMSVLALYSLPQADEEKTISPSKVKIQNNFSPQILSASSTNSPEITGEIEAGDARVQVIRQYLHLHHSQLEPYAELLISESDKNNIDWRLLTAIAQQESNLCKIIPQDSYNCWGWGIHSQGTLRFNSYEEAIKTVARGLRKNYLEKGYTSIEEIMAKYTPLSKGSWANGVSKFLAEIGSFSD